MRRGISYGVMAGALWGAIFLAPAMIPDFSDIETSAGRYSAYGIVSLLVALPSARTLLRKLVLADVVALAKLALVGNLLYYLLLCTGVRYVGIAPTSLIIGTLPVTITLLGSREHGAIPLRRLALPLLIVLAGIVCINLDVFSASSSASGASGTTASLPWLDHLIGVGASVGALITWTWYALANTRALHARPRFSGNEWSLLWGIVSGMLGAIVWLVIACLPDTWRPALGIHAQPAGRWEVFWIVNAALAIGGSLLGNALWNAASRRLPMTLMGQMIVFETLFALLYGFLYATRLPTTLEAAAIVLLVTGVIWSVRLHAGVSHAAPDEAETEALAESRH